jgi:AAA+ ATPase superfamily predicted ATPase
MELLFGRQSPLFGRMTGQWRLLPMPFGTLTEFLPHWSPEELVAQMQQHRSRMGRYHLSDPFLRFHFRFLEPYAQEGILSYQPERVLPAIQRNLRAFVGSTAWEELARQWILAQRTTDTLGFSPEIVGSHWRRTVQIDVVAINWQTHDILLGECKWDADSVDRKIVRELIARRRSFWPVCRKVV